MDIDPDTPRGRRRLEKSAEKLMKYNTQYYTGHCTGARQYEILKEIMGDQLHSISTGNTFFF
jgi:7,8-dihydropterin-6-yl-methyl-4-(beta-D-ribofuranosyl)aminobenzene 5'-phosphate synthase